MLTEKSLDDTEVVMGGRCADLSTGRGKNRPENRETDALNPQAQTRRCVRLLVRIMHKVLKIEPEAGGIGGGKFFAFFRKEGIPVVVWSQENRGSAHQPDEYMDISYLESSVKILVFMMAVEWLSVNFWDRVPYQRMANDFSITILDIRLGDILLSLQYDRHVSASAARDPRYYIHSRVISGSPWKLKCRERRLKYVLTLCEFRVKCLLLLHTQECLQHRLVFTQNEGGQYIPVYL